MPVIIVTAPGGTDAENLGMLGEINSAVTAALGLPPDAAHTILVPVTLASTGTIAAAPWPVAILHGRSRPADERSAAVNAVTAVLMDRCGVAAEQVWVQWAA